MCLQCLFLEMCSTDECAGGLGFLLADFLSSNAIASSFSRMAASFSSSVGFLSRFARFFFFFFLAGRSPSAAGPSLSDGGELGPRELDDPPASSNEGPGGGRWEDDDDEDAIVGLERSN